MKIIDFLFNILNFILKHFFKSLHINNTVAEEIITEPDMTDPLYVMKKLYRDYGALWEKVNIMGVRNETDPGESHLYDNAGSHGSVEPVT